MSRPALGDVVVRARGLANHLLDHMTLLQLAHASGSSVLAGALENVGYWPAPTAGGPALSAARIVDRAIEHEILMRLAVLARWLGDRVALFAALFELEVRDALRIRLRELSSGAGRSTASAAETRSGWPELRDLRSAISHATDLSELIRVLSRVRSPYAPPLGAALRAQGDDPRALETALDRTWASRARRAAASGGDPLLGWVEDEIDLQNAWAALAGGGGFFLEGGRRLPRSLHESIAAGDGEPSRRRKLALAFRVGSLAGVFDDPDLGLASLEARARVARIAAVHRAARLDPIGASPILEVVMRLWAERADLRCISWGIATGLSHETIAARLVAAA